MAGFRVRALLDLQMATLELCPYMEERLLVSPASSVVGKSLSYVRLLATPGLQHARLLYLSLSPRVCSNLCALSW